MRYLCFATLQCVLSPALEAADESATGDLWYGTMDIGTRLFRFRIEPVPDAPADRLDEIWTGTMSALFQKLAMRFRVYRVADDHRLDHRRDCGEFDEVIVLRATHSRT